MPHAFSRKIGTAVCKTCAHIQNHPFHYGHTPEDDDGPSGLSQALDIAIDVGIIASAFSFGSDSDNTSVGDIFSGGGGDFGGGGASSDW